MPITGRLGTIDSRLGLIMLGRGRRGADNGTPQGGTVTVSGTFTATVTVTGSWSATVTRPPERT
jgi:hypothetical protein